MKIKNVLLTGVVALGLAGLAGCNDKDDFGGETGGEGILTIKLVGNADAGLRAPSDDTAINNYKLYVFNANNGILEKRVDGDVSKVTQITQLSTGSPKNVVVLANLGADANYPAVTNYEELSSAANAINLLDQLTVFSTAGYAMSGKNTTPIVLSTTSTTQATVMLDRIMAKIKLGTITIDPAAGHDPDKLDITGVSVQRLSSDVTLSPITGIYGTPHYGGIANGDPDLQVEAAHFYKTITMNDGGGNLIVNTPKTFDETFYVFPNEDADNCTLLTIEAVYGGQTIYYPVKINHQAVGSGNTDPTGNYVKCNTEYTVNLTLKKFGNGTVDPEIPSEEATLEVTIDVNPWKTIIQNEEW